MTPCHSSLREHLDSRLAERPILLMAHAVVGYPSLEANWEMLECMSDAGVDVVELQLPFSEPIADGPWFIKANQVAIDHHLAWQDYFDFLERAAAAVTFPILFMGYYNSIFRMGTAEFCKRLHDAGAKGYIVADLPPEEADELHRQGRARGLDPVLLMTPTNSEPRLRAIAERASGFVYCVARKGVTGKKTQLGDDVGRFLERCRAATDLPLALGFGIKTAADVEALHGRAEIAIVGTACLEAWEKEGRKGYAAFLRGLRAATEPPRGS